jgi:alcohol dehydrogenase class IV
MIKPFSFARTPHLIFGNGKLAALPSLVKSFGSKILLVTGANSFLSSDSGENLLQQFRDNNIDWAHYPVQGEPTPETVDAAVDRFFAFKPHCVVAIGGGSTLDAGKAISAMLPLNEGVKIYLEGVGTGIAHPGTKIPFVAIPTTSGTGSEATKNAVICERGDNGYKRSLRHDNLVPDTAIVDPLLTLNCPADTTAASGMDAFTQLLESYVSTAANPLTDALALEGLRLISKSLLRSYTHSNDIEARGDMSLAAYISGVTLANAGLGLVHGFASPVGGFFHIPHGVICSTLMAASNKVTIRKLRSEDMNAVALGKYAIAGRLFSPHLNRSDHFYVDALVDVISMLRSTLNIRTLAAYGVTSQHHQKIVPSTDSKNNPVALTQEEMFEVLALSETI